MGCKTTALFVVLVLTGIFFVFSGNKLRVHKVGTHWVEKDRNLPVYSRLSESL
jgi:hypothetical protein